VKQFVGCEAGGSQNGSQAHALSRELEFGRPAQGGATPFCDPPASQPQRNNHSKIGFPLRGNERQEQQPTRHKSVTHVLTQMCYRCLDRAHRPTFSFSV
jgi:hypothetical protein